MALKDKGGFLCDKSQWNKMKKNLMKGRHLAVDLGFFPDAQYGPEGDYLPVAQVAAWNDGGTINNPPRPFLRYYIETLRKDKKLTSEFALQIHKVAMGEMTWSRLYSMMGEEMKVELQKVIAQWFTPPNAPYTIEQKGFNDPLIHTGKMHDSVDWRLSRKNT